jgi:hypothetical protein
VSLAETHYSDGTCYHPDARPLLYLFDGCSVSYPETNSREQFSLSVVSVRSRV